MASPSVRADEGVLGDFLGVSAIVPERDGAAEDFFAVAGPDFQESGFIAGVETTDAFGVAGGGGAAGDGSFGERAGGGYARGRNRGGGGVVIHGIFCFKGGCCDPPSEHAKGTLSGATPFAQQLLENPRCEDGAGQRSFGPCELSEAAVCGMQSARRPFATGNAGWG